MKMDKLISIQTRKGSKDLVEMVKTENTVNLDQKVHFVNLYSKNCITATLKDKNVIKTVPIKKTLQ
jgi:hypothetical protein